MRAKIIAVNAGIVIFIGLLAFLFTRSAVTDATGNTQVFEAEAKRSAQAAAARLQLDGLRTERWLSAKAGDPMLAEVMTRAVPSARGDAATQACDAILSAAKSAFAGVPPSIVLVADERGRVIGRNGTNGGRGDDLAALYPGLKEVLANGQSGSEVWYKPEHSDQYLVSYVAIKNEAGKVSGAIAAGFTLNDELSRVSDSVGHPVKLVRAGGAGVEVIGSSSQGDKFSDAIKSEAKGVLDGATATGVSTKVAKDVIVAGAILEGFADGRKVAVLSGMPSALVESPGGVVLPWILLPTIIGLVLVVIGGWLLGDYMSRPIGLLEEGLLAIINGQTERRFGLDHAELGAIASRIDQLLNQLLGVEEDNTDDEGRVSVAPVRPPADDLEERGGDGALVQRLASEPADAYYQRIYSEYISAKKALREPTDHITVDAFRGKIQQMEQEASQKHGKPVRYQVQGTDKEIKLVAVPLG